MAAVIPVVIGLAAAGAIAFGMGSKKALAAPKKPSTHKPKAKPPTIAPVTEAAVKAAMNNPAAMKKLIDATAATGDAIKLWNLGRTILLNSKGKPAMQAVASQVLISAVKTAAKKGTVAELVANALANGDGAILASAAKSAGLLDLANQLARAGKPTTKPSTKPQPATTKDQANAQAAAQAATAVMVDAIKKTEQVQKDPPAAPVPTGNVTTLPEVVITASPPSSQVMTSRQKACQDLVDHFRSIGGFAKGRFKEDKSKVGQVQKMLGLSADGKFGPSLGKAIASEGVVPVVPFYWTKGKVAQQKADYKAHILKMAQAFPDLGWSEALDGLERS